MRSVDIGYVDGGPVKWESVPPAAAVTDDSDEPGEDAHDKSDEQLSQDPICDRSDNNDEGEKNDEAETSPRHGGGIGARGVDEEKGGEPGGQQDRRGGRESASMNSASDHNDAADEVGDKEQEKDKQRRGFSFATELFFLTHRALQVIVSSLDRRRGEMLRVISDNALAKTGRLLSNEDEDGQGAAGGVGGGGGGGGMAGHLLSLYKEASTAISLGWALEGFGSDAVAGHGCQLANFTACWLGLHIGGNGLGDDGLTSTPKSSPLSSVTPEFSKIASSLIETMCASWVRGAVNGQDNEFLSRRAAEDAAICCGQIMERVGRSDFPVLHAVFEF